MAGGFFLLHLIPFDGKLFDDPEQAIFSLVLLNLVVFVLLILALMSVREGRRKAARQAKARRRASRQGPVEQLVTLAEPGSNSLSEAGASQTATRKVNRASRPAAANRSKNYTRPSKK